MSSSRPKMMLDEQSFQDMLAAAFTIQEHNAQRKRRLHPEPICQCGAPLKDGAVLCQQCTGGAGSRPGEELQRKWASLWMMSQEQGLWSERPPLAQAETRTEWQAEAVADEFPARHFPDAFEIPVSPEEMTEPAEAERESDWPGGALVNVELATKKARLMPEIEVSSLEALETIDGEATPAPTPWSLRDLRLKLRFHRADLYLVVAIGVSTVAMLWVLSATPAPGAHRKPRLRPWERALIAVGLAEAPEPPPRRGDPNFQVWVDPKTALYYCAGEEDYGKAPGGHVATQREAQMDQFQPAGRAACE
jgi:hypothetical protein